MILTFTLMLLAESAIPTTPAAAAAKPAIAVPIPEKSADARGRVVCKRFSKTGSLVSSYRTCKTKWEWERERENLRTLSSPNSCGGDGGCALPN